MANGPRTVIVTNRGQARLADLQVSFAPLAEAQGRHLIALNPQAEPERLAQVIAAHSGGRGCDDIVVIAPDVALMAEAARHLAADGMLALFAGVPLGNTVPLPLDQVARHGAQFTGTSGSSLADQQRVIARILAGDLAPARSVAAVGGLTAAAAGLQAVLERLYPGKVMLYPQLLDLPLLSLAELEHAAPPVYAKLGPNQSWTAQAEQALFEHFLARSA
jgi:threonine dehydrogenase-like Zn-dependent dehydrogenase